jgi:uncharacterized protein YjiS (DUF1127 family)
MMHFLASRDDCTHVPVRQNSLVARLAAGWREILLRRRMKATIYTLHALDDRTLGDIGLDRSEIESVVRSNQQERRQRMIAFGATGRHH